MRTSLRCCLLVVFVVAFLAPSLLRRPIGIADRRRACRWARRLARLMGWRLRLRGSPQELLRPGLLVANHLSWIDPMLLAACAPLSFVTSLEIGRSRLLGDVARRAGCIFTDRRSSRAAWRDSRALTDRLRCAPVVVFPEATTGCGDGVLPFRPAFFQSALDAGAPVRPVCVRYRAIDRRPVRPVNRRRIYWYGDMRFLPHLVGLLRVSSLEIELTVGDPLPPPPGRDRKVLAWHAHRVVADCFDSTRQPSAGAPVCTGMVTPPR